MGRKVGVGAIAAVLLLCVAGSVLLGNLLPTGGGGDDAATDATRSGPAGDARALTNPVAAQLSASPTATRPTLSPVAVVQQVGPAVVTVTNRGPELAGTGTGFIVAEEGDEGFVVTNQHVVDGGESFGVVLASGETRDAELVGQDGLTDLAVLKIPGPIPATVPLGDSTALRPGQRVLAIGSALGSFTNTVTRGIVSAVDRDFPAAVPSGGAYANLVQHDAAINPGNSGGPLLNLAGEVVGVNTLGIPEDDRGNPAQGLFFAVPSNTVREVAAALIADGRVVYPFVGVSYALVGAQSITEYDLEVTNGVVVRGTEPGSPAEAAGLREGDVILAVNGRAIDRQTTFVEALSEFAPGQEVALSVARGTDRFDVRLTLVERAEDA